MKIGKSSLIPVLVLAICSLAFLVLSVAACGHLSNLAIVAAGAGRSKVIVVDAGHGGEDGGATGKSAKPEKEINLAVSKDLQQLLTASGFRVVMTRTTDTSLSDPLNTIRERKASDIHNRLKLVEAQGNCIFLSIHQNYFEQEQYHGTQVFFSADQPQSKELAESIRKRVVSLLQPDNDRETKQATSSIYLLWHAKVPAVLVECGFLSNEAEAEKLNSESYQQQMAFAVCCGILDYCSTE